MLKDILEHGIDLTQNEKSYCLTASYSGACAWNTIERSQRTMVAEPCCIAQRGRYAESGNRSKKVTDSDTAQYYEARTDGKSNTLTTVTKDNGVAEPVILQRGHGFNSGEVKYGKTPTITAKGSYIYNNQLLEPIRIGDCGKGSQATRIYSTSGKSVTLCGQAGGGGAKTGLYVIPCNENITRQQIYRVSDGKITVKEKTYPIKLVDGLYTIRRLTVTECKRLQTVPENYKMPCSAQQNYKMLGNGWTVDVIAHILSHIPNIKETNVEVLSMYDGMSCGHIALDKLGVNIINYYATEIDKYAIKTTFTNYSETIFLGDAFNVRKDDFKIEPRKADKTEIKSVLGEQLYIF